MRDHKTCNDKWCSDCTHKRRPCSSAVKTVAVLQRVTAPSRPLVELSERMMTVSVQTQAQLQHMRPQCRVNENRVRTL